MSAKQKKIVIVGGGFTGATAAIHFAREAKAPLEITVVEPRADVGRGVAYSTTDPDHRVNAPAGIHFVYQDDTGGFETWLKSSGILQSDLDIAAFDGSIFPRRSDWGAYVCNEFKAHIDSNASSSSLHHIRDHASSLTQTAEGYRVLCVSGNELDADLVVVTTSNETPNTPHPFPDALRSHPSFVGNPWDTAKLSQVNERSRVLIIGAGLTAADVMVTLLRDHKPRRIDVISRHGLRPTGRPTSHAGLPQPIWDRLERSPSLFGKKHGPQRSVLTVLKHLRTDIATAAQAGIPWQSAFDDVRDSARKLWIGLPLAEKRRFVRHLRRLYDVCRFRYPPQTQDILDTAEHDGRIVFHVGQATSVRERDYQIDVAWGHNNGDAQTAGTYDCIVNCVGPPARPDQSGNQFLKSIVTAGHVRASALDIGLEVDDDCRAVGRDSMNCQRLFVLGPLTFVQFGYPLGVPFITHQIVKAMPGMLAALQTTTPAAG